MKNLKKSITNTLKNHIIPILDEELYEWPPTCSYIMYQPERPIPCDYENEITYSNDADK